MEIEFLYFDFIFVNFILIKRNHLSNRNVENLSRKPKYNFNEREIYLHYNYYSIVHFYLFSLLSIRFSFCFYWVKSEKYIHRLCYSIGILKIEIE